MRDEGYYKLTTSYSLGKLLAVERIFALEGIYPQLDAAYGEARLKIPKENLIKEDPYRVGKIPKEGTYRSKTKAH